MPINRVSKIYLLPVLVISILAVSWLSYYYLGHQLIRAMYEHKACGFLNTLIGGQSVYPLSHYYKAADSIYFQITTPLIGGLLFFYIFYIANAAQLRTKANIIFICLLFFVSIMIRFPALNRHISSNHEDITAHSLIALKNLETQGAFEHKFCILKSYPLEADKFVQNNGMRLMDKEGNWYYSSFPPFSIIFPYLIFKLLSIDINVLNLQLFNVLLHLISTIFIYFTICLVLEGKKGGEFAALLGSVFFIFLAPNMWYFSNAYSWDIFWHHIWIPGLYYITRMIRNISRDEFSANSLYMLGIINFFLIYSEYQGVLFAISIILYSLTKWREPPYRKIAYTLLGSSVFALLVILWQYSSAFGFEQFLRYEYSVLKMYKLPRLSFFRQVFEYYWAGYSPAIMAIVLMAVILFKDRICRLSQMFTKEESAILYMAYFPVVIHILVMIAPAVHHDYYALKTAPFFVFLIGILYNKIEPTLHKRRQDNAILLLIFAGLIVVSIGKYKSDFSECRDTDVYYRLGDIVRNLARDDEVVFSNQLVAAPVIYYANRNIQPVGNADDAKQWLRRHGRRKGIVIYVDDLCNVTKIERISI